MLDGAQFIPIEPGAITSGCYSLTGVRTAIIGGSAQMAGDPDHGLPPFWLATALLSSYTAALVIAATAVARRREIR